jgi:hypothetical protein
MRVEGHHDGKIISIKGTKKGFLRDEEISILIQRSDEDPDIAAYVTAEINGQGYSEHILQNILIDILNRTGMLDNKLQMKLDIVLKGKKIRYEGGRLIIE